MLLDILLAFSVIVEFVLIESCKIFAIIFHLREIQRELNLFLKRISSFFLARDNFHKLDKHLFTVAHKLSEIFKRLYRIYNTMNSLHIFLTNILIKIIINLKHYKNNKEEKRGIVSTFLLIVHKIRIIFLCYLLLLIVLGA